MEKIILNDTFRVSDSKVRGYVVIKQDGKIIVKKENMIVESGREYIKDRLYGDSAATIKKIYFGNSETLVSSTDTLATTFENVSTPSKIGEYDIAVDTSDFTINKSVDRQVVYTINVTKAKLELVEDEIMTELGLVLSDDTTLFSRLTFEGIPITDDHTYEIKYYIYF